MGSQDSPSGMILTKLRPWRLGWQRWAESWGLARGPERWLT